MTRQLAFYTCVWISLITATPRIITAQRVESTKKESRADEQPETTRGTTFDIERRIQLTTSRVVGQPDPPPPFRAVRAYPDFTVRQPIYCEREPDSENFFLIQHLGGWAGPSKVLRFRDTPDVREHEVLIESSRLVYGLTFHPNYKQNGYVYLFGNGRDDGRRRNRISRFTVDRKPPYKCDPESEFVIIEWDSAGHDGGDLEFGPDGMLYLTSGDGSSSSDSKNHGQTLNNLNACVLRIDVDHPNADDSTSDENGDETSNHASKENRAYSVPKDNPFWTTPGARPEVWAYGLRNPWRLTFDRVTGHLWIGINGQDLWESAQLVKRGENYGWPIIEGSHDFHRHRLVGPSPIVMPTVEHPHSEARSLTGGVVYHGKQFPLLQGAYIYGDFSTGKIWAVRHDGERVTWHREIAGTRLAITGFALDHAGELLVVDHAGGLYHLEPTPTDEQNSNFPTRLSETGLFADVARHQLQPGMIPYSVNAPRWADHASLDRYLGIPADEKVSRSSRRAWKFPEGTVILQTFAMEIEAGRPESERRIETQLLTLQRGEWAGYSYRWNDAGTDAELVPAAGADMELVVSDLQGDPRERRQIWRFPSRAECAVCHNRAVDYVLGLTNTQINRDHDYGETVKNQLLAWDDLGLFREELDREPSEIASLVDPHDETETLETRAMSYLHVNCHHCHVHEGGGNSLVNFEYEGRSSQPPRGRSGRRRSRRDGATSNVGMEPQHGKFGLDDPRVIVGGHPERSVLYFRLAKLGQGRMPYVGSNVIDTKGLALIRDWISGIEPAESGEKHTSPSLPEKESNHRSSLDRLSGSVANQASSDDIPKDIAKDIETLFASTSGGLELLCAVDQGRISTNVRTQVIKLAAAHPSESIRDLFERFLPPSQRVQRLGQQFDPNQILSLQGNAAAGRLLYFQSTGVQCNSCHAIGGEGKVLGPDLGGIGRKFERSALLLEILEPSRKIDPEFSTYRAITSDGKIVTGLIVEQNENEIVLKAIQGEPVRLAREEVDELAADKVSLMPEHLLQNLTAQQAADLLEFLSNQQAQPLKK